MFRSQNLVHFAPLLTIPISTSACSVNGACPGPVGMLRKSRTLTHSDAALHDAEQRP